MNRSIKAQNFVKVTDSRLLAMLPKKMPRLMKIAKNIEF